MLRTSPLTSEIGRGVGVAVGSYSDGGSKFGLVRQIYWKDMLEKKHPMDV